MLCGSFFATDADCEHIPKMTINVPKAGKVGDIQTYRLIAQTINHIRKVSLECLIANCFRSYFIQLPTVGFTA